MGLDRATGAKGDDVLRPLDPFTVCQFQHLHLVQLRDGGKVEAVEAFEDSEPGRLDAALREIGIAVSDGQAVAVMEAMKLEVTVRAMNTGRVSKIFAKPGATVSANSPLIAIET